LTDAFGGYGGIAAYNRDVLTALADDPRIAEIVAVPRIAQQPIGAVPPKVLFDLGGLGGPWAFITTCLRHALRNGPFDLVYCAHINLSPLAWLLARLTRAPWLLCLYGIEAWEPVPRWLVRMAVKWPDRILSISALTLERFRTWVAVDVQACTLMPNAVHLEAFGAGPKNHALARRLGVEGRQVILTFGRLAGKERYKGFDEILEVLPALMYDHPDLVYMIAGDGEDRDRLEAKASRLGIADRVIFTGMVDEDEKVDLYRLADVYAMPSRGEGFGFVLLEAMASGVPTIASALDGGREAVRDGMIGAIVDPDDPEAIKYAINCALAAPKGVPPGLTYFSFDSFRRRLQESIAALITRTGRA
jgi:glycosyltransferase involved in cell wall biosynthesis